MPPDLKLHRFNFRMPDPVTRIAYRLNPARVTPRAPAAANLAALEVNKNNMAYCLKLIHGLLHGIMVELPKYWQELASGRVTWEQYLPTQEALMRPLKHFYVFLQHAYAHLTDDTYDDYKDGYGRIHLINGRHWPELPPTLQDFVQALRQFDTEEPGHADMWTREQMARNGINLLPLGVQQTLVMYANVLDEFTTHFITSVGNLLRGRGDLSGLANYIRPGSGKPNLQTAAGHIIDMLREVLTYAPLQDIAARQRQAAQVPVGPDQGVGAARGRMRIWGRRVWYI